jgi:Na+/H+ antiporter NhaD/arsenite permease-like protein
MSHIAISFVVLGVAVVLFVWNRFPPEIVAIAAALSLYAAGVITSDQLVAGFGDPTVVFIASLLVVSEGLDSAGVTTWAGQQLMARAGSSRRKSCSSSCSCSPRLARR